MVLRCSSRRPYIYLFISWKIFLFTEKLTYGNRQSSQCGTTVILCTCAIDDYVNEDERAVLGEVFGLLYDELTLTARLCV